MPGLVGENGYCGGRRGADVMRRTPVLREYPERGDVPGLEAGEMPTVGGDEASGADALGGSGHCGVDESEGQVGMRGHELGRTRHVGRVERLERELASRHRAGECHLGARPEAPVDEVGDFGEYRDRNQDVLGGAHPPTAHPFMPSVVPVEECVERAGVGQDAQGRAAVVRRSFSRSDVSLRPPANWPVTDGSLVAERSASR
jgi:hypothetical protein